MKELEESQHLSYCKSTGILPDNSAVLFQILPKFKLIQIFMIVLNTCKNEEDPVKTESARVVNIIYFKTLKGRLLCGRI